MAALYTSADPLISLLHDDDIEIQEHALDLIDKHLSQFWSQLSNQVDYIISLTQTHSTLESRAALVLSKLYYHLGDLDVALQWSLQSKKLLTQFQAPASPSIAGSPTMDDDSSSDEEYNQAMIAKAIDVYITYKRSHYQYVLSKTNTQLINDEEFSIDTSSPQYSLLAVQLSTPTSFTEPAAIDDRIATLLSTLIDRSIQTQEYSSALGLAVDSLRLDWIRNILITISANEAAALMKMAFKIAINVVDIHSFQQELLTLLVELYQTPPAASACDDKKIDEAIDQDALLSSNDDNMLRPSLSTKLHIVSDVLALCQCLLALNDAESAAQILLTLLSSETPSDHSLAYQVAFDLMQGQQISFTSRVAAIIFPAEKLAQLTTKTVSTAKVTAQTSTTSHTHLNRANLISSGASLPSITASLLPNVEPNNLDDEDTEQKASPSTVSPDAESTTTDHSRLHLYNILTGVAPAVIHNHFLYRNAQNHDDWFKSLAGSNTQSDASTDSQLYVGYSLAQCGTHRDGFIRTKWQDFEKLSEWAQFSAKASIGNVYKGQAGSIKSILNPFLPNISTMSNKPVGDDDRGNFNHGGSLFALGLTSCGMNNTHLPYLSEVLKRAMITQDEPVQAGAALSLGLCGVGCGDVTLFEQLRDVMWGEKPIAGFAAGIATGLIFINQFNNEDVQGIVQELLASSISQEHRQIQLGQGLALALIHLNAQEGADTIINYLRFSKISTPFSRWAACWIDAMAYVGTGNERVIQRLLHYGTSDPDSDVKRTAIISLSFVLLNDPEKLIEICENLSTSYNEHIRYGVALALGIGSTSSGVTSGEYYNVITRTIEILTPLLKDTNEVVRQGAIIGYSMALLQTSSNAKYRAAVDIIEDVVAAKKGRVSLVHKVGASLGAGILHAGGMNSSVRLIAPIGNQKRAIAIAGMMIFCNFWHWFPLTNMFSLTLAPTGVIGTYLQPSFEPTAPAAATSANILGLSVPNDLKYVVKTLKQFLHYPTRLSDDIRLPTKKVVVNQLSTSKGKKGKKHLATTPAATTDASKMDDTKTPSGIAGTPTLGRSTSTQRTFASDLLRTNSTSSASTSTTPGPIPTPTSSATASTPTLAASPSNLSITSLQHTQSQVVAIQKQKDEKLPIAVISNCTRLLPRHIPSISCPKGQQYHPIKDRLFGIVVLQKMFEKKKVAISEEIEAMILANITPSATDGEKQDGLAQPPAVPPAGDISQSEPIVPQPFSMNDD